ncbi:MAG TPA: hypothetical protein VFZ34_29475 [Blastocatellia bacterium]|nr:hypothetical protein [Blastocatellia bacterium]
MLITIWLVLSGNTAQAQHKFSGWIFQPPANWHADISKEDVVMVPLDLEPKEVEAGEAVGIVLYPGKNLKQPFQEWFDQEVMRVKAKAAVIEEAAVVAAETEQGISTLSQRLVLRYPDDKQLHRVLWAVQLGKRVEYLMFVTTSQELYQRYRGVLEGFLRTVCFVKHPCPEDVPWHGSKRQWLPRQRKSECWPSE